MKNSILQKVAIIIFIATFIISITINSCVATTQKEVNKLKEQAAQSEKELNAISEDKEDAESELDKINSQVESARDKLDDLKNQLDDLNSQIKTKEKEIEKEEEEIAEKDKLLKDRMVALYEAGDSTYLDVLFNSEDLMDFISSYSVVQTIFDADTSLINELESKKAQLETDKTSLEENKEKVDTVKTEQEKENANLETLKSKQQTEVNKLSEAEKTKQSELEKYNTAIRQGEAEIQTAIKKAEANNTNTTSSSSTNATISTSSGTLAWPLSSSTPNYNRITSYFGPRESPTAGASSNHGAIDIGVSYAPVYSAESGTVMVAGPASGYGNFIMIKHNGNLYTAYGHLSAFKVSAGQTVKRGQLIAISGNTGISTGPHLHFEVRAGGSASSNRVNPLNYAHW